jgi:murein DD-endopeptidase MepM/ murein hydrolase activator NlpD
MKRGYILTIRQTIVRARGEIANWAAVFFLLALVGCELETDHPDTVPNQASVIQATSLQADADTTPTVDDYGFVLDSVQVEEKRVRWSESLYTILRPYLSPQQIYVISRQARPEFNPRELKPGQRYRLYVETGQTGTPKLKGWAWLESPRRYVAIDLQDSVEVRSGIRDATTYLKTAHGVIRESLYQTIRDQDLPLELMYGISDLFAWQIDFFTLRPGDRFSVVYEEKRVGDELWMIGDVVAAEFTHQNESYTAFRYFHEDGFGFYDDQGRSVQKTLLKAPLHYRRISSGFSYNRMHPVLHRRMAHLGVDYAAPIGTAVVSTGAGTVIEARYRGANGNIVKVRHNGSYTTAYLHLNGFAEGIRRGATVEQGQTIGYVGNTGRSTGPHLDYRVYKNGRPVNPLRLELPPSESISDSVMEDFEAVRNGYMEMLYDVEPDPALAQSDEELNQSEG